MKFLKKLFRKRGEPEPVLAGFPVEFSQRFPIVLTVTPEQCLTPDEIRQLGRFGKGVIYWWLLRRGDGGLFSDLDLPRGDTSFELPVLLPPGRYVLGVGRDAWKRRLPFEVAADGTPHGEVVRPFQELTEAAAQPCE